LEALAVSLAEKGRVDLHYMSQLTGMEREEIIGGLKGVIYPNPAKKNGNNDYVYETAEEYLSGNVRRKLAIARQHADTRPETFAGNVTALEETQPPRLNAGDIGVRLGAAWVDVKYVQNFVHELLGTSWRIF
jgi:N12 class adenine-specific DNA methylase